MSLELVFILVQLFRISSIEYECLESSVPNPLRNRGKITSRKLSVERSSVSDKIYNVNFSGFFGTVLIFLVTFALSSRGVLNDEAGDLPSYSSKFYGSIAVKMLKGCRYIGDIVMLLGFTLGIVMQPSF